jgi:hypothetical protein
MGCMSVLIFKCLEIVHEYRYFETHALLLCPLVTIATVVCQTNAVT